MSSTEPPTVTGGLGGGGGAGGTEPYAAEGALGAAEGTESQVGRFASRRRFTAVCYLPCGTSDVSRVLLVPLPAHPAPRTRGTFGKTHRRLLSPLWCK